MKYYLSFLLIIALFASCNSDDDNGGVIISDPVGSAQYLINNQSSIPLNVIFKTSTELDSETISVDDTIESSMAIQIFQDAIIGVNPTPIHSFSELSFFDATSSGDSPILIIDTISNDDWTIVEQTFFNESGSLALTTFQLTITDEDF